MAQSAHLSSSHFNIFRVVVLLALVGVGFGFWDGYGPGPASTYDTEWDWEDPTSNLQQFGKRSAFGLFNLATKKPHTRSEPDVAYPPVSDSFVSVRGKKRISPLAASFISRQRNPDGNFVRNY